MTQDTAIARNTTAADLVPGYRLVQLVGRGGMGEVHQAIQLSLGRTVAVKLLKPELAADEQFVGRFEKEGAALATLRHPNIVSIVDRGRTEGPRGTWFLVMEFVDGPSLRERMRDPDFDATKALVTMLQVTRAIDYAHSRGVIHRDLKPENILLDEQAGQLPKVSDFGLAGFDARHDDQPRNLTQTHVSMGTVSYMAPEQGIDARSADGRADIYSLGVMLYELLTGAVPVGTFPMPSVKRPGLDKRLDGIVSRCLKPAPEDRYQTAGELLVDLEALVQFTSLPSLTKQTRVQRTLRRARELALKAARVVAVVVVLAALVIIGAVFARARAAEDKRPAAVELTTDFGVQTPLVARGRVDRATRVISLGEGPDTVSVLALGRAPRVAQGALVYDAVDGLSVGRAVVDAEVVGEGFEASVVVDTEVVPASRLEPLWALFRGPRPDARSALMVLGEHGRYLALVTSGSGAEPTLEWSLGPDKRGLMQAPLATPTRGLKLSLRLDAETGELFAVVGAGRDARVLGDGVWLGPGWRSLLGESPRLAVGCLQGRCTFHEVRLVGLDLPHGLSPPAFPLENVLATPANQVSSAQKLSDKPPHRLRPQTKQKPVKKAEPKPPSRKK